MEIGCRLRWIHNPLPVRPAIPWPMNSCSASRAARRRCRKGRSELYQYVTARTGKAEGDYLGLDFETEAEHGCTDKFQASILLAQHYFNNYAVDGSRTP